MATPHDLYLRFLATKGYSDYRLVAERLEELNLKGSDKNDFYEQSGLVERSVPKFVWKQIETQKKEGTFLKWMRVLEVGDLWEGEKGFLVKQAKNMLTVLTGVMCDPHICLCINALLIKGVLPKEIASSVNAKFSALLQEEHLKVYQKYFFDPRRLTRSGWRKYLKKCDSKEQSIYFTALTEPLDILKTELELPSRISVSDPLQILFTKSYQKAKHYLETSTKEANQEARAWISTTVSLAEKYEKFKTGDREDFSKQLQMTFEFVNNDFPTPDKETLQELLAEQGQGEGDE